MTLTREQRKAAFEHVVTNVIGLRPKQLRGLHTAHVNEINTFLNMTDQHMRSILLTDTTVEPNITSPITNDMMTQISLFMYFLHH